MISLLVSGVGAVVAAVGGGALLARCFRQPRGDLIAWAVAMLGLLVSLGSQLLGHLTGFDSAMFRGMELGGQVIAPLALILALSELAARSTAARFCARLYIPALALVAVVVLSLDQLAQATFSKAWPDPSVFYQVPPNYLLMFAIGPLTTLITVIAVGTVLTRSSQPAWNAVLPAALMGGVAALALAYPCLAELVTYLTGIHVPVASEFAVVCVLAAVLAWLAADRAGRVRLSVLHRGTAAAGPLPDSADADDYDDYAPDGGPDLYRNDGQDLYRDGGLYRSDQPARAGARSGRDGLDDPGYGWQDDRQDGDDWQSRGNAGDQYWDDSGDREFATGDFVAGDYGNGEFAAGDYRNGDVGTGDFATGDFATGDFAPGAAAGADHPLGYSAGDWQADDGRAGRPEHSDGPGQMFGQIAIYTLIEDRVEKFDQLTERVVEQVRSREPDTLVFIVHAVPSAPMQRILYEVYRDRAAYQRHTEQPYVRQFEADRRPFVLATNVIELGLQQAKVSAFPSVTDLFGEPGYDTSGFERPDFLRDYGRTSGQSRSSRREYR